MQIMIASAFVLYCEGVSEHILLKMIPNLFALHHLATKRLQEIQRTKTIVRLHGKETPCPSETSNLSQYTL